MSPSGSVTVFPDIMTVSHYNGSAVFTCASNGGPNNVFRWIKGDDTSTLDGLVTPLDVGDIISSLDNIVSESYQLSITDITGSDEGGVYTCIVINEAGYDVSSATLYVSPEITIHPIDHFVEYGDFVNLTCKADSHPPPIYQWEKMNRVTMSRNGRSSMQT